jgi:hypothetical protein
VANSEWQVVLQGSATALLEIGFGLNIALRTWHSALKYGLTGRFALPKGGVAFRGQQALRMLQECQVDAAENSDEGKWVMANGTCGEAYYRFGF